MMRPILYKGRWYSVPTRVRNDAYVKSRNRGCTHDEACRTHTTNWMRGDGPIRKRGEVEK